MRTGRLFLGALILAAVLVPFDSLAKEDEPVLSAARLATQLRQYVLQHSPWAASQVEVEVQAFTPLRLPPGPLHIRVLKPRSGITPGPRRFFVAVSVAQREIKRAWVQAEVHVFDNVVVTSRPLANHEPFSHDNVRIERRELSALTVRALTRLEDVLGKNAAYVLRMNAIVTAAMVKRPRVVRRGGGVTMFLETRGLRVAARGQALQPGSVGDVIRVKNASSGKIIEGQIIDAHTVRVNW